jgi:hypothetical protein
MLLHGMTAKSIRERYPGPWEDMNRFRVLAQDGTLICTIFAYQSLEGSQGAFFLEPASLLADYFHTQS